LDHSPVDTSGLPGGASLSVWRMLSIGNGLRAGWRTACLGRRAMSSYKRLIITAAGTDDYEIITKLTSEIQLAGGNIEKR